MPQILKEELKEQILSAAKKEFLTKDFQNASIRNIAKSLSCSAGNIYNYFENKDALFLATVQETISEFEEARKYIAGHIGYIKIANVNNLLNKLFYIEK